MEFQYENNHKPIMETAAKTLPSYYEPVHVQPIASKVAPIQTQHCPPAAVAPVYGFGSSVGSILVLFILLVIILRAYGCSL